MGRDDVGDGAMIRPEQHLGLVGFVARRYRNCGGGVMEELIAEGMVALVRVARDFDAQRNGRFSTYAVRAIRKAMYSFLRREIEYRDRVRLVGSGVLENRAASPPEEPVWPLRILEAARLTPRESEAVAARFGFGGPYRTLAELAGKWRVTRQRAHQIQESAMKKIRATAQDQGDRVGGPLRPSGRNVDANVLVRCA